ncbi:MAG TPA: hypothetical protein PKY31_05800, partial [Spirochaetota bacterium]|nr:hypothetical protein [Spirochaetota bacterium]
KKTAFDTMTRTLNNKSVLFKAGGISESDYEAVKAQHTSFHTRYLNANADLEIQEVGFRDSDITSSGYTLPKTQCGKVKLYQEINTKMEKASWRPPGRRSARWNRASSQPASSSPKPGYDRPSPAWSPSRTWRPARS